MREPLVVVDELLVNVAHGVEGAGLFAFDVIGGAFGGVVNLHFESRRGKAGGLKGGVEVDAGVGAGAGHDFGASTRSC